MSVSIPVSVGNDILLGQFRPAFTAIRFQHLYCLKLCLFLICFVDTPSIKGYTYKESGQNYLHDRQVNWSNWSHETFI